MINIEEYKYSKEELENYLYYLEQSLVHEQEEIEHLMPEYYQNTDDPREYTYEQTY